jgi:hypothetical protein
VPQIIIQNERGPGYGYILFVVFALLKIGGELSWSWLVVFAVPVGVAAVAFVARNIIRGAKAYIFMSRKNRRNPRA